MSFGQSNYDRFLTNHPEDGFDDFLEDTTDALTETFWGQNEEWALKNDGQYQKWIERGYAKGLQPDYLAQIIERAHRIYKIQ